MRIQTKSSNLDELQKQLGIRFKQQKLLENAFIHRSYLNEHKDFTGASNERLEFLGDAVLQLIVSRHLFAHLSKSPEGELTQLRAALVRTETLAKIAQKLSLGKYLFLSKGEEESRGRQSATILANTFEALVGAIYLDQDLPKVTDFIQKTILTNWQELVAEGVSDNKSKLQEFLQRKFHQSPTYKLLHTWGPDHDRRFEIGVFLKDKPLGKGVGKNKQGAAQDAAANALTRLKG